MRRVTDLMGRRTGRLSGHQAERREESRHGDKKRERSGVLKEKKDGD